MSSSSTRRPTDWRVALIDTGIWRNIGERLWAVRDQVRDEEMFLANYSDGLTDVDLDDMVERFKKSKKLACFLAIRPPLTYHLADIDSDGTGSGVPQLRSLGDLDQRRIFPLAPRDLRLHARRRRACP